MIKIFIDDGMQIPLGTGIGKYTENLIENVRKSSNFELSVESKKFNGSKKSRRIKYIRYINSDSYLNSLAQYDVVHYTNFLIPFKKVKNTKVVVTIHDLTSFLYPEALPSLFRYYNRLAIRNSVKQADLVITVSDSVRNEILKKFPSVNPNKVQFIYPGLFESNIKKLDASTIVQFDNLKLKEVKSGKYFLFVGTLEKRKNIGFLIQAFLDFKKKDLNDKYKLVLAGRLGYGFDHFNQMIQNSPYKDSFIVTGYISDSDRDKLYQKAAAYVFPTVYEGFGIPTVECMEYNLPIILSDIPVNREVAEDYGIYFKLGDLKSLVSAMEYVAKTKLEKSGIEFLRRFDNDLIANKYEMLLTNLLNGKLSTNS